MFEVILVTAAREVRQRHPNALASLMINMLQAIMMVAVFYLMYSLLGLRGSAIRGDFLLYIMTGIFIYMTNVKSMNAVVSANSAVSPIMQHAPMNTFVSIASGALGALYIQILTIMVVLGAYSLYKGEIEISDPISALGMVLIAWFNGIAIGMIVISIKPWLPQFSNIAQKIYARANIIASGKMFVVNQMPFHLMSMFIWNPLFHVIDQTRGNVFINYNPHHTNWAYPIAVSLALLVIGMMGESYARKRMSISWQARR